MNEKQIKAYKEAKAEIAMKKSDGANKRRARKR